jgi:hypothetical protein
MTLFGHDLAFWIAVIGATFIKVATSPQRSIISVATILFIAVFSAYVFTDPVIAWLHMDPDTYKSAVAALVALSGEGVARLVISIANDPKKGIDLFKRWRGSE